MSILEDHARRARVTDGLNRACRPCTRRKALRIALIDPRPLVREALRNWLAHLRPRSAVDVYPDIEQMAAGGNVPCDLVVWAECGTDASRADVVQRLRRACFSAVMPPVVIVSDREDAISAATAIQEGFSGYILTSVEMPIASAALELVLAGGIFVPASQLIGPERSRATAACRDSAPGERAGEGNESGPPELTRREAEVLSWLRHGKPNKMIAFELGIRESTVKTHVQRLMAKLKATNRTQLAFFALQQHAGAGSSVETE